MSNLEEEQGRTVIIRGSKGEILISSTNKSDKLKDMLEIVSQEYFKKDEAHYIS